MSAFITDRKTMISRLEYHTQNQTDEHLIRALYTGLAALDLGEEHGIDGPACTMPVLIDADGYAIPAKIIVSKNGPCWILRDEAEAYYGTRFLSLCKETWCVQRRTYVPVIPQKMSRLGITEQTLVVPASQRLVASFRDGVLSYIPTPLEPLKYFYTKIRTVKP